MSPDETPLEISCSSVKVLLDQQADFLFLDCREPDEYELARIQGAALVPMSQIQARLTELLPRQTDLVVVHCHAGVRSLRVARWLRQQGFPQAQSMAGGIEQWSIEIDGTVPRY